MRKNQKGFTLIEMIVVIAITSLFLYASYILMIGAVASSREARNRSTAANLALREMDTLRLDYNTIPVPCPGSAGCSNSVSFPSGNANITYSISYVTSETITNLTFGDTSRFKLVKITVSWNDPKAKSLVMESKITPYSPS